MQVGCAKPRGRQGVDSCKGREGSALGSERCSPLVHVKWGGSAEESELERNVL